MAFDLPVVFEPLAESHIPNRIPQVSEGSPRIAFVVDCPDEEQSSPIGMSHFTTLHKLCSQSGVDLMQCFIGGCLNFVPKKEHYVYKGKTKNLDPNHPQIKSSLEVLLSDLKTWRPQIVVLLGRQTLKLFKGDSCDLEEERGVPFFTGQNLPITIASYHPRETYILYPRTYVLRHDIKRALHWAIHGWSMPKFELNYLPSEFDVISTLTAYTKSHPLLSVDIETVENSVVSCICLCPSPTQGIVIPFLKSHEPYWPISVEARIWKLLAEVLETCPLMGQFAIHYDHLFLFQHYGICANFVHDTMVAQWERCSELPKSLAYLNSLYGELPYWKGELSESRSGATEFWSEYLYNGKDGCSTFHAFNCLAPETSHPHYLFNLETSRCFQHMSVLGARLDESLRQKKIQCLKKNISALIRLLEHHTGKPHQDVFAPKKLKGMFSVRSPKQMKAWLYEELELPPEFKRVKNVDGETEERETADFLSLLHLAHEYPQLKALKIAGILRKRLKRLSALEGMKTRSDGTLYWTFNIVGTKTGRAAGYKPFDGLGVQPQNVDRRDRNLFLPSLPDSDWYKFDLEGADSWTVAATLAFLGFPQLMEDLLHGLKPAQRVALTSILGDEYISFDRDFFISHKGLLKSDSGKQTYLVGKKISHGTSYNMKPSTMHESIFKETEGELFVPVEQCASLQKLLISYYHLDAYHAYITDVMHKSKSITTCFGMKHDFIDRPTNELAREMMAFEPQANTTYVTNTVLHRLYYDPINRNSDGSLIFKPCNQVHDEGDAIGLITDRERISKIFYSLNRVPLKFRNIEFEIPFDAERGPNWGNCHEPVK